MTQAIAHTDGKRQVASGDALDVVVTELPVQRSSEREAPPVVDLPDRLDDCFALLRADSGARAQAYRLLCHRLAARDNPRTVVITSPGQGEGKTTCALNVALAFAEEACRTLLVEANPSRPIVRGLFGLPDEPQATGPWSMFRVDGIGLDVACPASQGLPLRRGEFLSLMYRLRDIYDYLVIDTPPALESADANLAAEAADAVVLTAIAGRTRRKALRRTIEQLSPAPVAGVVLLDAPGREVMCR